MAIFLSEKQVQEGWQVVKFGEIAKEVKQTTKTALEDGLEFYVGLEHLDPQSLRIQRKGIIAEDNPSFTRLFKPGQLLFGKRRCYQKKAAVADFEGICSGDIIVMEAIPGKIIPELLPFIVQSDMFFDWAEKTSSGSLSPRTKWKALAALKFPLPPIERQKEIFEVLEKVEHGLTLYEEISGLSTTTRNAVLNEFFKRISQNKENIVSGDKLYKIGGGNAPKDFNFKKNGDTIYVKVDCFNDIRNQIEISFYEWMFYKKEINGKVNIYPKGSIIFPKRGAAIYKNRVGILGKDAAVDSNIMVLQCENRIIETYLKQYLLWRNLSQISDNSGVPQLNNKHLYPLEISLASIPEQSSIANIASKFDLIQKVFLKKRNTYFALKRHILRTSLFQKISNEL